MAVPTRRAILALAGLGIYGGSLYVSYHSYKLYNLPEPKANCQLPENQKDYSKQYDQLKGYDDKIKWDELLMGLGRIRNKMCLLAKGDVLEIAAGTGRNLEYYPKTISSLTLVDSSKAMLQEALIKYRNYSKDYKAILQVMDCHSLKYESNSFDTVVQSFGLCSQVEPAKALKEMARVCRPGGQILLLEHGRSNYDWLNWCLDKTSEDHAKVWGCWWNRDIIGLVNELGLKVSRLERYHLGTTVAVVLEKNQ